MKKRRTTAINNKKLDRRVKLTDKERTEIKLLKGTGVSQSSVALQYGVSRRTVDFIWHPEKLEQNKQRRAERGGSSQYYDKQKHRDAMREHRAYKKELKEKGLI